MKRSLTLLFPLLPLALFMVVKMAYAAADSKMKIFLIESKYINFPLGENAWGTTMDIFIDGTLLGRFNVDLQEEAPYFHGFIDVESYKGKTAEIIVHDCPTDLSRITHLSGYI